MRLRLLILFQLLTLSGFLFSLYSDPPLAEVTGHNSAVAQSLLGFVPPGATGFDNCTLEENPSDLAGRGAIRYIAIQALALSPAVDDRVSAVSPPSLIWGVGASAYGNVVWETTLSGTTCTSHAEFTGFSRNADVDFSFMDTNATSFAGSSNPFPLPGDIVSALDNADANSTLNVTMRGRAIFTYDLEVNSVVCTPFTGCTCERNSLASGLKNVTFNCGNTLSYKVEGGPVLPVLVRPALKEQWFRDNNFDSLLLTKRKLYKAEVLLGNGSIGNASLYQFNVTTDAYNLEHIVSIGNYSTSGPISVREIEVDTVPTGFEQSNDSFAYVYEINSSYEAIGWNNLTFAGKDHFGNSLSFQNEILSRQLSFAGNVSEETGTPVTGETVRPSAPPQQSRPYNIILVSGGVIGLLLVIVLYRGLKLGG
jgi:hypothetical protein